MQGSGEGILNAKESAKFVNILLVKRMSLSVMSFLGSPNKETTLSANMWAASTEDTSVVVGAKRTNFESFFLEP